MENKIPAESFFRHVEKLRESWVDKTNYDMDSIILINGKGNGGNQKTIAIFSWFFAGYNLADTIIFFSTQAIIIYASDRKVIILSNLKDDPLSKRYNLSLVTKTDDFVGTFTKIWSDLHGSITNPKVGLILNDVKTGLIAEEFVKFLETQTHSKVQAINFLNECFITKDLQEIDNLKKSGKVTSYYFAKFIKEVQVVIDNGKPTKHSDLAKKILEIMENESQLKKCAIKLSNYKIVKDYIDLGAPCSIQSGGSFTAKLFVESNQNELKSDCIVLGLGSMYRSYNSYIGRTLLIDPNEEQKAIYKKVQTLSKVLIQNIRPGVKICDIYKKARQFMHDTLPNIEVPKHFGYGMGIFLTQNSLAINQTNDRVIQQGNSFLVSCNFPQIKYESKKDGPRTFAIQITDNVIVNQKGQEVLTNQISKNLTEISYSLQEDNDNKQPKPKQSANSNVIQGKRRKVQEATTEKFKNQGLRNERQIALKLKKLQELKQRSSQNFNGDFKKQKTIQCSKIECYKSKQQLPKDLKAKLIYIDNKTNCILLPINGQHVPFSISILKSVVKNDEGKYASIRFNFHLPNSIPTLNFPKYIQPIIYVKEVVFRSQNISRVSQLQRQVKALQKKSRVQLSEKHAKEDIVDQQKININKGKRPNLRDLYVRPGIGQKKTKGNLQCHLNGFRYSTIKGQVIDVAFSNIKFAFFQPCQKQIIAAIHFRLNQPILVGKKKTEDIQFYSEGGVVAEDVVGRGRNQDSDDEERQKQIKKRIDRDFFAWTKACDQFIHKSFQFQIPNRHLGFYGTTFRSNVLLQPTKTCLINITEPHFFVFCIEDIEVVWFQRMTGNVRYFDLTLVHKDYEHHVRINSISIKDVEKVKDWLDSNGIIFYDNKISVNWSKFLQGVRTDFKKFVEDGAWTAWDEADGDEMQGLQSGDSQFSAKQQDFDQDSQDSEQSQSDFEREDDDSDDSSDSQQLSEKGLDWDEMEEKAQREDKQRIRRQIQKEKEREHQKGRKR